VHGPAWHICVADVDMMGIFYHEYADMLLVRDERWRKAYLLTVSSVVYEVGTKIKRKRCMFSKNTSCTVVSCSNGSRQFILSSLPPLRRGG
jgi:hypothetical protein